MTHRRESSASARHCTNRWVLVNVTLCFVLVVLLTLPDVLHLQVQEESLAIVDISGASAFWHPMPEAEEYFQNVSCIDSSRRLQLLKHFSQYS